MAITIAPAHTDLLSHLTSTHPTEFLTQVNLLKIAADKARRNNGVLKLALDVESCLDRLYGGYYPDWVCGGQWNKMEQYLNNLTAVIKNSNLELVLFFDGCLDEEFELKQKKIYDSLVEVEKHLLSKKTPPPKVWWIPPGFLREAIRLYFRSVTNGAVTIQSTLDDHRRDVAQHIRKNHLHGLISDDSGYLAFDHIDRLFSAKKLKLTYKGSFETTEFKLPAAAELLQLSHDQFLVFAALFGFVGKLSNCESAENLCAVLRSVEKLDPLSLAGLLSNDEQVKAKLVKASKFCLNWSGKKQIKKVEEPGSISLGPADKNCVGTSRLTSTDAIPSLMVAETAPPIPSLMESDSTSPEIPSLMEGSKTPPQTLLGSADQSSSNHVPPNELNVTNSLADQLASLALESNDEPAVEGVAAAPVPSAPITNGSCQKTPGKQQHKLNKKIETVATTRHSAGLMSPYICQILKHRHLQLPTLISSTSQTILSAHDLFRPLRSNIYALLFNLHHLQYLSRQSKSSPPSISVLESYYEAGQLKQVSVPAQQLTWSVPTVERLWLGDGDDCKQKRLKTFFSCLHSDREVLINSSVVPQRLLVLCCVLRYIISEKKFLRRSELDAFIIQALLIESTNSESAQEIELSSLTIRNVHLSHLFMHGIEMALLLNDACGAPIPYMLFTPWQYFNGKVFNYVLEEQARGRTTMEICGFITELVYRAENLRMAVMDGVKGLFIKEDVVHFAPFLPTRKPQPPQIHSQGNYAGLSGLAFGSRPPPVPSGVSRQPIANRRMVNPRAGGQLEIAGQVVGQWGANYGAVGTGLRVKRNPGQPSQEIRRLFDEQDFRAAAIGGGRVNRLGVGNGAGRVDRLGNGGGDGRRHGRRKKKSAAPKETAVGTAVEGSEDSVVQIEEQVSADQPLKVHFNEQPRFDFLNQAGKSKAVSFMDQSMSLPEFILHVATTAEESTVVTEAPAATEAAFQM